jgi:uncharacterized RDD family membrane protein YckC
VRPDTDAFGNEARDWHGYYAGFGSRMMAYVIDAVLIVISFYLSLVMVILFIALATLERPTFPQIDDGHWLTFFLLWAWLYFFYCFGVYGKTPGKAMLGLRVVTKKGEKLGWIRSCFRGPAYLVSYLGGGLGFIWIAISKKNRGWHDHIVGSAVVYDWDARPGARYRAAQQRVRSRQNG